MHFLSQSQYFALKIGAFHPILTKIKNLIVETFIPKMKNDEFIMCKNKYTIWAIQWLFFMKKYGLKPPVRGKKN